MLSLRFPSLALLASVALCNLADAKPKLPDWALEAIEQPAPPRRAEEKPTFEIIWDEAHYDVLDNGRIHKTVRYAIRILDLQERWRAKAVAWYYASSDTRPKLSAWTLHSDGEVHKYKKSDENESTNSSYLTLQSESRSIVIDGWNETRTGDVFAYEYTTTEATIFTQYYWRFQSAAPAALSRLTITTPDGWRVDETYFGATPTKTRAGNSVTWQSANVLSKDYEPYSPTSAAKQEYMIATITPPDGSRLRFTNLKFNTWADLAAFKAKVGEPMAAPTPEIIAKAKALTAGAESDWQKIQALGEFAKAVNYEHVALQLGNGGGYTPRPASETFRVGWGDCKDKSTLLRAMLKAVGIESYLVTVNATDNDSVEESLPSPFYFDHCITAVVVDETVDAPAVYQDENLGRLLFIDPTWNNSPIGEIPFEAQGGLAVVGAPGPNPLVRLPLSAPEENRVQRDIKAEVMANGAILGRIETARYGQAAVDERRVITSQDRKSYIDNVSNRFAAGGNPSPVLQILAEKDDVLGDRAHRNTIDFAFRGYAKLMRNTLVIFKPAILDRIVENPFSEPKRELPVRLRSRMLDETAEIYPPDGYEPDEFKPEINIESDFGSYRATLSYDAEARAFHYARAFIQQDITIPVERYAELRAFFTAVVEAEQTPVVLARQ